MVHLPWSNHGWIVSQTMVIEPRLYQMRHGANNHDATSRQLVPWFKYHGWTMVQPWYHRRFYRGFYGKRYKKIDYSKMVGLPEVSYSRENFTVVVALCGKMFLAVS